VLKHETSTTYQSHIYESIDLKFGLDMVITSRISATLPSLVKIVSAGGAPHVVVKYTGGVPFIFYYFCFYIP